MNRPLNWKQIEPAPQPGRLCCRLYRDEYGHGVLKLDEKSTIALFAMRRYSFSQRIDLFHEKATGLLLLTRDDEWGTFRVEKCRDGGSYLRDLAIAELLGERSSLLMEFVGVKEDSMLLEPNEFDFLNEPSEQTLPSENEEDNLEYPF